MTHIKPTHVNKLSLWLNCSTGRDRAGTGRRGAYGQALGTNARLVIFPSLPPLLFFFPHCDRCRVAKFIPNLIAVRQWTQCWIVYYFASNRASKSARGAELLQICQGDPQRPFSEILQSWEQVKLLQREGQKKHPGANAITS